MAKFIGLHSLPGFTREMLEMARQDASRTSNIQLLATYYDSSTGRVICQVEAPDKENFIAWLNRINMPYDEVCKLDLNENMVNLTREEWNIMVRKIQAGELKAL